jgi:hypothetical protein
MEKRGVVGGAALAVAAIAIVSVVGADALTELGIREADAKGRVVEALNSGYVSYQPAGKALKSASPAVRETLITGALAWARSYTETPEFRDAYAKLRERQRPAASAPKGGAAGQMNQQRAELEKGIAEAKKTLADLPPNLPPDVRKTMQEAMQQTIAVLTAQLAEMDKPQSQAMMTQMYEASAADMQRDDAARMKEFETRYPADSRLLIARRLRQFLDESATVDFGAKVVTSGSVTRFADPKYEQKSSDWKLCYRAGSAAVAAARQFATAWLADIEKR